jgi:hypothetical protein
MSRRLRLGLLLVAALMCASPEWLYAQQTEEELLQHLDSLLPLLDEANEVAREAVARHEAILRAGQETTVDTFMVGPLTVVAPIAEVSEAKEMYGEVWEEEFAHFVTRSPALERTLFTFSWSSKGADIVMTGEHSRAEARAWHRRAEVERRIKEAIGKTLELDIKEPPARIFSWARGAVGRPDRPEWLYRQLATTPSRVGRACVEGQAGSCWQALGIEASAESLLTWYTPEERRDLALGLQRWVIREAQHVREACLRGEYSRCDELLTQYGNPGSLIPLPWYARMAMVWVALDTGGEGAWDRLVEDPTMEPVDALLHASGASLEELEAKWRTMVLEQQPKAHAGLAVSKWTALFWILILAALAMRSTRWRLA